MLISELSRDVIAQLKKTGIESAITDAEVIISYALDTERYKLVVDQNRELSKNELTEINKLVQRRLNFEPVAYITGRKEFYSLDFVVDKTVLIPRPETELLVDLVIYYAGQKAVTLDLGTGSGAIAISVKHNRNDLTVYASDLSEDALRIAEMNSEKLLKPSSIKFISGNLFEPFYEKKFDIIVSNPPYINRDISMNLQKDLSFEPEVALFSDDNGKKIITDIITEAKNFININGMLILEIGADMKEYIIDIGAMNGYSVSVMNDYSGLPRVAVLKISE